MVTTCFPASAKVANILKEGSLATVASTAAPRLRSTMAIGTPLSVRLRSSAPCSGFASTLICHPAAIVARWLNSADPRFTTSSPGPVTTFTSIGLPLGEIKCSTYVSSNSRNSLPLTQIPFAATPTLLPMYHVGVNVPVVPEINHPSIPPLIATPPKVTWPDWPP